MTETEKQQLRIKCAIACGWKDVEWHQRRPEFMERPDPPFFRGHEPGGEMWKKIPDYLSSRDLIIAAVLTRTEDEQREIVRELFNEVNEVAWDMDDLPIVLWSDLLKLFTAPPSLICSAFVAVCSTKTA